MRRNQKANPRIPSPPSTAAAARARGFNGLRVPDFVLFLIALSWKLYCLRHFLDSEFRAPLTSDSASYWAWSLHLSSGEWIGHNAFFLGPLYPYLLALTHVVGAPALTVALGIQCVLGALTVVLVYRIAHHLAPQGYAFATGLLAAGYSMSTYLDLSVLSESLLAFLELLFLLQQLALAKRPFAYRDSIRSGLLVGLMALARPSAWLLLLPHMIGRRMAAPFRQAANATAICAGAALLVCLPVLIRHLSLGHGSILSTYSLGYNLYIGNSSHATGTFDTSLERSPFDPPGADEAEGGVAGDGREYLTRATGRRFTAANSSAEWTRRAIADVAREPLNAARRLVFKAFLAVNRVECAQVGSLDLHEHTIGALGPPLVGHFGLIGILGGFGLLLIFRKPSGRIVATHALAMWAPMIIFFVTDRYRYHLALPILAATAPGLEWIGSLLTQPPPRARHLVTSAPGLLGCACVVWLPIAPLAGVQLKFGVQRQTGEALLRAGDLRGAAIALDESVSPEALREIPLARSTQARRDVSAVLEELGEIRIALGEYRAGALAYRRALEWTPDRISVRLGCAVALGLAGDADALDVGTDAVQRSLLLEQLVGIGGRAATASRWPQAEHALRTALVVDSTSEVANVVLFRMLRDQGRGPEAMALLSSFERRRIPPPVIARESSGFRRH